MGQLGQVDRPTVAVSACLLGEKVRYDGSHKWAPEIIQDLEMDFEIVSICPEILLGLGVPRRKIFLTPEFKVMDESWQVDYAESLKLCARDFRRQHPKLVGMVLKSGSPSCGVKGSVKVYHSPDELVGHDGTGQFAQYFVENSTILLSDEKTLNRAENRRLFKEKLLKIHMDRSLSKN